MESQTPTDRVKLLEEGRVRLFFVPDWQLFAMVAGLASAPVIYLPKFPQDFPEDCWLVSVNHYPERRAFGFLLADSSFATVSHGCLIPELVGMFDVGSRRFFSEDAYVGNSGMSIKDWLDRHAEEINSQVPVQHQDNELLKWLRNDIVHMKPKDT